ncbi:MAG: hypothetical protein PHT23_01355 [Bacteroidales bacterium]|nr:hypothetical protein [Bacteroidales bacterium]
MKWVCTGCTGSKEYRCEVITYGDNRLDMESPNEELWRGCKGTAKWKRVEKKKKKEK